MANAGKNNFDFFDQFKDMEIDLTKFLKEMSAEDYELKFSNIQPVKIKIKNLFEQYRIVDKIKSQGAAFETYSILEGEKPEDISQKFYDTIDFWWLILMFNNIKNPFFDMPLSEEQVIQLAATLYTEEGKYPKQVYYRLIFHENEKKRNIIIPRKPYVANIVFEFRKQLILNQQQGQQ